MSAQRDLGLQFLPRTTAVATGAGLLVVAFNIVQVALLAEAALLTVDGKFREAAIRTASIVAVALLRGAAMWGSETWAQHIANRVGAVLRHRLFTKLVRLGPGYTVRKRTTDVVAAQLSSVEAIEDYCARYQPIVWLALLAPVTILAYLASLDWLLALALAAGVVLVPLASAGWHVWQMPRASGIFSAIAELNALVLDTLQGLATLKAFNASVARRAEIAKRTAKLRSESMRVLTLGLMHDGIVTVVSLGALAAVLLWGVQRVTAGEVTPFALIVMLLLGREAFRPVERLGQEMHAASAGRQGLADITTFMAQEFLTEPGAPASHDVPRPPAVRFESICFAYPGSAQPVLHDVTLEIYPGETVALVGPSGAGKSTLAALLLRFLDPAQGSVSIGGVDVRELPLSQLREMVALVAQDTYLFPGTIEQNIRLAHPDATREQVLAAAEAAHAHEFIVTLPQDYATEVGERGRLLSGGQRQRIALARAILKDAPILVLDEATSGVDQESERAIVSALSRVAAGRTVLIITHRDAVLSTASRVLQLKSGRVVAAPRLVDGVSGEARS